MTIAKNGDARAQLSLGRLYLCGGEGLAANDSAALHWLSLAAREGVSEAEELIAESVASDRAGSEVHRYIEPCERAAARGNPAGHCALGVIYASPADANVELDKAKKAYRAAAQAGHAIAARKLGLMLAEEAQSERADATGEAVHWLHLAAKAGDRPAAQNLGALLWRKGDLEAAQWLEPEAQGGDLEAMYRFGEICCRQSAAEQVQRGVYWLELAARKGHALALWRYGRLHVRSFNDVRAALPHSPLQASRLLERAAAAGVSEALWDLARIYEMPRFSRRNLGTARHYLEQAASAGICEAELELGKRLSRYKNDRGAWVAAGRWLSSAAAKGSNEASALLAHIADRALDWQPVAVNRQEKILQEIRDAQPIVAARLELAARFGLSPREMLFINPLEVDRDWCIEVDLSAHFKRAPWRLVIIESEAQRLALERACGAFLAADNPDFGPTALSTMGRARQLKAACLRMSIDPALFVRNWIA